MCVLRTGAQARTLGQNRWLWGRSRGIHVGVACLFRRPRACTVDVIAARFGLVLDPYLALMGGLHAVKLHFELQCGKNAPCDTSSDPEEALRELWPNFLAGVFSHIARMQPPPIFGQAFGGSGPWRSCRRFQVLQFCGRRSYRQFSGRHFWGTSGGAMEHFLASLLVALCQGAATANCPARCCGGRFYVLVLGSS